MRLRFCILVLGMLVIMQSCKMDNICVAYQSYFLLDEDTQSNTFAYLDEEGIPRRDLPKTDKTKNGLIDPEWYVIKNYNKRVLPMEVVYPQLSDSAEVAGDIMMFAETDVIDSVALDSLLAAAGSFRYNNDQKFYNWYFKDKLVWKDEMIPESMKIVEVAPEPVAEVSTDTTASKPKLLKRLFKGKKDKPKKEKKKKQGSNEDSNGDSPNNDDSGI